MSHALIYILCIVTGFMLGFLVHKELVFGAQKMYHDVHKILLLDVREMLIKLNQNRANPNRPPVDFYNQLK